jgi:hypothetical protein
MDPAPQALDSLSLQALCERGFETAERRWAFGRFLHAELQFRLRGLLEELETLPHGLNQASGIRNLLCIYRNATQDVQCSARPTCDMDDHCFIWMLRKLLEADQTAVSNIAESVMMLRHGGACERSQDSVDEAVERVLTKRVGLRLLMRHYVDSYNSAEGFSGVIQVQGEPAQLANNSARECMDVCRTRYGRAPAFLLDESAPVTMMCLPEHVNYILREVIKNAFRAVVERHEGCELPPVRCAIEVVPDRNIVSLKVTDEGGGIAMGHQQDVWKFAYTTSKLLPWGRDGVSHLAGYGVGLPLSRLYARCLGGDLHITSREGTGTEVCLELNLAHDDQLQSLVSHKSDPREASPNYALFPQQVSRDLASSSDFAYVLAN